MSLEDSARGFVARYHGHAKLKAEQKGWCCRVVLAADDTGEAVGITVENGAVIEMDAVREGGDVLIRADSATLHEILCLRLNPNEPFMFGTLSVDGPEAHFLRLDYIVSSLAA